MRAAHLLLTWSSPSRMINILEQHIVITRRKFCLSIKNSFKEINGPRIRFSGEVLPHFPWVHERFIEITSDAEFLWHLLDLWFLSATPFLISVDVPWRSWKVCLWEASSPAWVGKGLTRRSKSPWHAMLSVQHTVEMPWGVWGQMVGPVFLN